MANKIETVVIGGGQAGLSLSYYLTHAGREHIVLEKAPQIADAWRNRRWDSFTLVTPNWAFGLPGAEYTGPEPGGFMGRDEVVRRFDRYAISNGLPVRCSTEVTRVEPVENHARYRVITPSTTYLAKNVVISSGFFQQVKMPAFAAQIPEGVVQIVSDAYRNPQALPPGAVLVVGSGQSGSQIAEELNEAGRTVYMSTGAVGRIPRRYRGSDGFDWLNRIGFFDRTPAMLNSSKERFMPSPHLSGKGGGHEINLHRFSRDGILLLGHILGFADGKLSFAADLKENLARADAFAARMVQQVDDYIRQHNLKVPTEEAPVLDDGFHAPEITTLDLSAAGIGVIIWATGYTRDYSMVNLPLLDADQYPDTERGVTRHPGLYFLGMAWMNKFKTGFLFGIAEAAQYLSQVI